MFSSAILCFTVFPTFVESRIKVDILTNFSSNKNNYDKIWNNNSIYAYIFVYLFSPYKAAYLFNKIHVDHLYSNIYISTHLIRYIYIYIILYIYSV